MRLGFLYPNASISLSFSNPLELLVATILSAQCTDAMVNHVTPALFAKYKTCEDYATANAHEFESLIVKTGFYRNKAKWILGAARELLDSYGGVVPRTMVEIISLPGVARKTGNVVLYNAYGIADGIAVDTHVGRLSRRLGLSAERNPIIIERDLMRIVPREEWGKFSHRMISHGRNVCSALKPKCDACRINDLCPTYTNAVIS